MRLAISHTTKFLYSLPARSNINELRLAPEESVRQKPGRISITIEPGAEVSESRDLFGNLVHYFEVEQSHRSLLIVSETEVVTASTHDLSMRAMAVPLRDFATQVNEESLYEFTTDSSLINKTPATWREAIDIHLDTEKTWGAVMQGLSDFIFDSCEYQEQLIHIPRTASEVQEEKCGTCQDFAHLMISYCRALGMPTRYVSGYLYDPGLDQKGDSHFIGSGATHAWVEVHVPKVGWVGIDPTNRKWVDENYVSISFGRDYHDVAPVRGTLIGGGEERTIEVDVSVRAIR